MVMQQNPAQNEIAWKMTGNAAEIADILAEFAEEVRRGDVVVWKNQNELHLDARGKMHMAVRGSHGDSKDGLQIHLTWSS